MTGPLDGYADRDYLDGFVYMDPGTADSETDVPGLTWYWGYNESVQYTGDAVQFHGSTFEAYRVQGVAMDPWAGGEEWDMPGLDLSGGKRLWRQGPVSLGVSFGVNWCPEKTDDFSVERTAARETMQRWRHVDTYSAPWIPFPDAPYAGSYEGPGYLINNIPDSRDVEQIGGYSREWKLHSTVDFEVGVLDLRIGPSLWLDLHERLALRLTPQVRFAQVESKTQTWTEIKDARREILAYGDRHTDREWLVGCGMEAEARVYLGKGWHLGFAVASDWWEDDVDISADPFEVLLELGQWSFVASLGVEL